MLSFSRTIRHPFYPALKASPVAARASGQYCALAGTFEELAQAARAGVVVTRAVFPLYGPRTSLLTAEQRDELWAAFQVPVYAMLVDGAGHVIGYECEMQEGFHFPAGRRHTLPPGTVEDGLCECGRPGPRLLPQRAPVEAALATTA